MSGRVAARLQALERDAAERRAAQAAWVAAFAERIGTTVDELEERDRECRREAAARGVPPETIARERMAADVRRLRASGWEYEDLCEAADVALGNALPDETREWTFGIIRDVYAEPERAAQTAVFAEFATSQTSERETGANGEKGCLQTKPARKRIRVL